MMCADKRSWTEQEKPPHIVTIEIVHPSCYSLNAAAFVVQHICTYLLLSETAPKYYQQLSIK